MAALDHVVVNALHGLPAAAATFAALGFTLTPLGRHSLGSINHLMMTAGAYLELVGVPDEGLQRQEVLDSPFGLNGLVFATTDAEATAARLQAAGLAPLPTSRFSRPVTLEGETRAATFETVRLRPDDGAGGRIYFCRHETPELVWRPEWLAHSNGFVGLDRMTIAADDPAATAAHLALVCDDEVGPGPAVNLEGFRLEIVPGAPRFTGLSLRFTEIDALERRARRLQDVIWTRHDAERATLVIPALELHLVCRSAA